jgi:hypothetical protein
VVSDHDVSRAPAARDVGNQVGADAPVKLKKEVLVERAAIELAGRNRTLQRLDARGQVRRELGVTEDAERGIQVTGCRPRRSSSRCRMRWSTGSPPNAMLRATFRGKPARRIRACSSGVRFRQRSIVRLQSMAWIICFLRQGLKGSSGRRLPARSVHQFLDPFEHGFHGIGRQCTSRRSVPAFGSVGTDRGPPGRSWMRVARSKKSS